MSDAQLTAALAILTPAIAAFGALIRWAILRVVKAIDDNTAVHKESIVSQVAHAAAMAVLSTKIDTVFDWTQEHSGVHDVASYAAPAEPAALSDEFDEEPTQTRTPLRTGRTPAKGIPRALTDTEYSKRLRKPQ